MEPTTNPDVTVPPIPEDIQKMDSPALMAGLFETFNQGMDRIRAIRRELVLRRLRESKRCWDEDRREDEENRRIADEVNRRRGRDAGRQWAQTTAAAAELARLADDMESDCCFNDGRIIPDSYSDAERFVFTINPDDAKDRDAAEAFWGALGNPEPDGPPDAFVDGFAEGAVEVWDEVKDQL